LDLINIRQFNLMNDFMNPIHENKINRRHSNAVQHGH